MRLSLSKAMSIPDMNLGNEDGRRWKKTRERRPYVGVHAACAPFPSSRRNFRACRRCHSVYSTLVNGQCDREGFREAKIERKKEESREKGGRKIDGGSHQRVSQPGRCAARILLTGA